MRVRPLLPLLAFTACLGAQQSSTPPDAQLSPGAAYSEAMHPLELTRHNIANWSDIELAAMQVTITRAREGCLARKSTDFTGSDLIDLARLCSLGQQLAAVVTAATRYIDATPDPKPRLTEAYIAKTEALLRLQQEPAALDTALTMLRAVPYSTDVGDVVDEALAYMRYVHTADALKLAAAREPLLLATLALPGAATGVPAPDLPSAHVLFQQGLAAAALQQLAANPAAARATVAALEAALLPSVSPDETLLIDRARRQYALLGQPITDIHPLASLSEPVHRPPQLPVRGAITAMLLFPDWCAACVRMSHQLPPTVFTVEGHSAYLYALLAETVPPRKPPADGSPATFSPAFAAAMMQDTASVTVPPALLQRYAADDFPLLLIADSAGILRVLAPLASTDVRPGGEVDAAIAAVGRRFSPTPPAAAPKTSPVPQP